MKIALFVSFIAITLNVVSLFSSNKLYFEEVSKREFLYYKIVCEKEDPVISASRPFVRDNGDITYTKNDEDFVKKGVCFVSNVYEKTIDKNYLSCKEGDFSNYLYSIKEKENIKKVIKEEGSIDVSNCEIQKRSTKKLEDSIYLKKMTQKERLDDQIKKNSKVFPVVIF